MLKNAFAIAISVVLPVVAASAAAEQIKYFSPACVSEDLLDEINTYLAKGDSNGIRQLIESGMCTSLSEGTTVSVISRGFMVATIRYNGTKLFTRSDIHSDPATAGAVSYASAANAARGTAAGTNASDGITPAQAASAKQKVEEQAKKIDSETYVAGANRILTYLDSILGEDDKLVPHARRIFGLSPIFDEDSTTEKMLRLLNSSKTNDAILLFNTFKSQLQEWVRFQSLIGNVSRNQSPEAAQIVLAELRREIKASPRYAQAVQALMVHRKGAAAAPAAPAAAPASATPPPRHPVPDDVRAAAAAELRRRGY